MIEITDDLGAVHFFENTPKRIITLVPSLTETLYELGLEEQIIGVTKFCVHPYHLKSVKINVGGTKNVHIEKIKALNPDIIIANKEENTLDVVDSLRGICPVFVTDIVTVEDTLKTISDFGTIFKRTTDAKKWIEKIDFAHKDFQTFMIDKAWQKAAYLIWREPYMAAGSDTFINEMLKLNKFENIYENLEGRYPEVEIRKMRIQGDPELVFLSSEPYPFKEEHAFEIGRATHHAKTVFVDGEMFSWYGTRLFKAFQYFKALQNRIAE
ncbi:ABC transporter substrate-binding protein [Flavobacterium sp. xlx-214]|uniref:helical backbone metal receptor n=1 Tax=unclassified Flavobacterium TaxID=196869 RepID=UPI0013D29D4C|nr:MULTISPECIES: helical backbone metal receptor [unclassified Flavobacterium]MBA5791881.1 ABC transporter substrate-binding protein [Flavobacterium sp. xlx-221]QMI83116.1 ABC transporter substrate-binding protein [Flavobacterium sp. xlx-214]